MFLIFQILQILQWGNYSLYPSPADNGARVHIPHIATYPAPFHVFHDQRIIVLILCCQHCWWILIYFHFPHMGQAVDICLTPQRWCSLLCPSSHLEERRWVDVYMEVCLSVPVCLCAERPAWWQNSSGTRAPLSPSHWKPPPGHRSNTGGASSGSRWEQTRFPGSLRWNHENKCSTVFLE